MTFHTRIRTALADENLQAALDANAERRIRARLEAWAALPDVQSMRQRAHAIRAEGIANLDHYLEQFSANAQANGITIHRAANAAQAVQLVLEIAGQTSAKRIAKSKTMLGEEIALNPALEGAGIQVVETDLGEYIVQLRGEPPAHIITPAVHLRRDDVARLFHEKLGMPLTDDIPTMTRLARRVLRDVFLTAEVGISGVNFGVAESGTLVLLTNEGNGRMVTTVPPVHIALMGLERLVPTFDDLALLLQLLPRSATGQKITVYANLLHSPRRAADPDGPRERHLILVDNGRSRLRQSPLAEALYCIRCGACLNACPVFREIGGHAYASAYPGPIGSALSPALFGADFGHLARASSLCGACKDACPVEIDLPKLLLRVRAGESREQLPVISERPNAPGYLKAGMRLFGWAATRPRIYRLAQRLMGILSRVVSPRSQWMLLPAWTGWGQAKDFPRPARVPFSARFSRSARFQGNAPAHRYSQDVVARRLCDEATPSEGRRLLRSTRNDIQNENCWHADLPQPPSLAAQFAAELTALGGSVTLCRAEEIPGKITALLAARGITTIQSWEAGGEILHLPLEALRESGLCVTHTPDPQIRAGLTGALAAIAETGTLVIPSGPGRPLTASLLPEIHIAVLRAADILPTLAEALRLPAVRQAAATALVSGTSRTADIEMTLTIGVHGPGELHVLCLEE